MKNIAILGSTGSIGTSALEVIAANPSRFTVSGLAAFRNITLLKDQIECFRPEAAAVIDEETAIALEKSLDTSVRTEVLFGPHGYREVASLAGSQMVLSAMSGAAGLLPTLAAIDSGKDVALANKETIVMAGELVLARAEAAGVRILPVDSEHSALFQCLEGRPREQVLKLILTASGGPFFKKSIDDLASVTPADALKHPNWEMGSKITIDSATMMNKGLEVIEAMRLFSIGADRIDVVIHPQSIVHSMVAFNDGALLAHMGVPDMKIPIAYALSYPGRIPLFLPELDLFGMGSLSFFPPDLDKFRCLALALEAARRGGTAPVVLNASNEIAVEAFLGKRIGFLDIPRIVEDTIQTHKWEEAKTIEQIIEVDHWARDKSKELVNVL
ncbi:MAG: 1-deoxy-D-xylulose-5-phosphate reductoisomerase [Syntrophales bacterium]|nr:1-deoxy-D-xylulose-5-phosphate reductoisomerase [Syntrophales bacterium]